MARWRRPGDAGSSALAGAAAAAAAEVEAALAVPPDTTAAAYFDEDNTMMQGASIYHMAKGLVQRDFFTAKDLRRFAWHQVKFRLVGSEDLDHMSSVREAALAFIAGHRVEDVVAVGEEIWDDTMAEKVWPGTQALAQLHLDAGQRVWLVTATPVEIATLIAKRLGLTGALGTVSEIQDGVYTGALVGDVLHGPAKAQAVKALAEREGLDLARCAAYSDSANDIPLLTLVGDPCAINPDTRLRRYSRRQGWRVRDYRTGRKAARIGVPAAAGLCAAAGGVAAGIARRRRRGWSPF
ncbi:MAG: HAD family hydrolase [Actinomycetes bacterium]